MDFIDYYFNPNDLLFVKRLGLSALLGCMIGWEREYSNKTAGLKTHLLVSLGSCLLMLLSIYGFLDWINHPNVRYDPSRLAAQVINGIGFLAAGSILVRPNLVVSGLTTSASLWVAMGIGLAVGSGNYFMAIATTTLVLLVLTIIPRVEERLIRRSRWDLDLLVEDKPGVLGKITSFLGGHNINILKINTSILKDSDYQVSIKIKVKTRKGLDDVLIGVQRIEGVIEVSNNMVDIRKRSHLRASNL
ncbi:putative Mg2+ transporter-C (MgtC) family protein [Neobacillus niacini]|uniref:MgtC/SapB family protein n=1 Tax=Neobacillus driksii TaxID=3035913 RepID=UPI002784D518|nr:MgtC/SapB family protein [Neobacillus niacini]MDQ0972253.1 putative Mg2+ transporter-C (MgtC) family protein [Neobacillus niacini]